MENKTTTFKAAFAFSKGMVRDNNEDNFILNLNLESDNWTCQNDDAILPLDKKGALFVVADGMGGLNAGEEASRIAIETIQRFFDQTRNLPVTPGEIQHMLREVILLANKNIIQYAAEHPASAGLGTTLTIVWLYEHVVYVGWVGDSRVYGLRKNGEFSQLNRDHSLVQELVDAGKLDPEQAFYHPDKNIITRSLGDSGVAPEPDCTSAIPVTTGDRILVCSDGLNTMLKDAEIREKLLQNDSTKECAEKLVFAADAAGGHDNITVVLCDIVFADGKVTSLNQPLSDLRKGQESVKIVVSKRKMIRALIIGLLVVAALIAGVLFMWNKKPAVVGEKTSDKTTVDTLIKESDNQPLIEEASEGNTSADPEKTKESKRVPAKTGSGTPPATVPDEGIRKDSANIQLPSGMRGTKNQNQPKPEPKSPPETTIENPDEKNKGGQDLSMDMPCISNKIETVPLPSSSKWYVGINSFEKKGYAQNNVCEIKKKGFPAFMISINKSKYKVLAGPFEKESAAKDCAVKLGKNFKEVKKGNSFTTN